jgi:catechol 2,3-dioxygenase-like lactoylglutathione lyase family enzyme
VIDHVTVSVKDLKKTRAFYVKALAPLGYGPQLDFPGLAGFGDKLKPYLWFKQAKPVTPPQHLALVAKSRAAVDAFYKAALKAGAKDDGPPGVRAHYHPTYYGAFVIDPNGHPIEAVCHAGPKKR